jgi:glycerol-3-phosphate dehydrogenase
MNLRDSNIDRLAKETCDVLIIGGGINGAVLAASLKYPPYKL